jgi:hypothetical protein
MKSGLLIVCGLSFLLAGCDEGWGERSDRYTEDFSQTFQVKAGGRLAIENSNGSIEITGWDRNEVEVTGTKYAATEEMLKALKVDMQSDASSVRIRTVRPSARWGNYGARYVIRVPRRFELERVVSSNGHVQVRDVDGPARVRTSNAHVRTADTKGSLEIETSNGGIEVDQHAGQITGATSNARIRVDLRQPEPDRPIRLETSNGGIDVKLHAMRGNNVRLSTSNGGITVALPDSAGAQLRAETSNGHVRSEFDVQGEVKKNRGQGKIGAGGPYLDLTTSNGNINLHKL